MLAIQHAARFPNSSAHRLAISARRFQADHRRRRVVVFQVVAPDLTVAAFVRHRRSAKTRPVFADHHKVFAHVDIIGIDRDVATRRQHLVGVVKDRECARTSDIVII